MPTCRVCGEAKDPKEFTKMKHFWKYYKQQAIWCKACQKMYVDMKLEEKRLEEFQGMPFVARVEFK